MPTIAFVGKHKRGGVAVGAVRALGWLPPVCFDTSGIHNDFVPWVPQAWYISIRASAKLARRRWPARLGQLDPLSLLSVLGQRPHG